ncbi:MAG: alpha-galactosidase [Lachnospiraceae bacterium]|nr:alpha-galactosidase [Lachnospiraceae bacterium]
MGILFHQETKTFHLYNKEVSYIIRIMENGQLENLYYGKAIRDREDFTHLHEEMSRPLTSVCIPEPGVLNMQCTKQEYPVYGTGDYRSSAFTVKQESGSKVVNFTYVSHEIYHGKKAITPLPAVYTNSDEEACTLELHLHDQMMHTDLVLTYTIFEEYPVITRHAAVCHKGEEPITLEKVMSMSVEFQDMDFEMVQLSGAWARERYVKERKLEMGIQAIQGINGTGCGAEHNPFLALKRPDATEQQGEVYGFSLVYSGNFLAQTEVSTFDMTRVMLGIHPEGFSWKLEKGETFQTPEAVLVYSDKGLNKMSQVYHRLYRRNLMRGNWKEQPRPILLNNWEATYFDFTEEKILDIAAKAKEAGVELFVLDDGWFGTRNDDYRGLGDWVVNLEKLPDGIAGLSRKVEALGLKFGLWVELEMVNKDSDLYRAHPDWIIGVPGRFESHGRHQHVLDFSRKEVVDYIYEMISKVIRESRISYIKWDMNRYMTEPYSRGAAADEQGKVMHRYILGVYDLYTRLTQEFPEILFESCASGGARFDPAMLFFAPQTWTSDDTDASERAKIQYGTSYVYPLVSMGSHVSAVPNHQMFRSTPLSTRANMAYFGTFGYELDLNLLSEEELKQVKEQVAFMKKYRKLIQVDGDFYRLLSPFKGNETAWMVVSQDKKQAIAAFYQRLNKVNASWLRFRLEGLDKDMLYEIKCEEKVYQAYGDELMYAGIPIDRERLNKNGGDFASLLFVLQEAER